MALKEDLQDAKERMKAWWAHEVLDRPAFAYACPRSDAIPRKWADSWYLAKHPDDIAGAVEEQAQSFATKTFGAEQFPVFCPNYGAGIMASVLGAESIFKSETVWFSRPTSPDEIVPLLESAEMNNNNPWYARLVRNTLYASEAAGDNYQIGVTDLGGILDILASFLEPKQIFYAMRNTPGIIDSCRAIILEKWHKMYDELANIIQEHCHGTSAIIDLWDSQRWYPLQCDFAYMLSPKWFERFVLPDLVAQAQRLDHAIYHLDGIRQLPYLDALLAVPEITGIQWMPGENKPPIGADEWMPVYRKIQAAGKNIVGGTTPELAVKMYRDLDPRGLYVSTYYPCQIWSDFFLPSFLGGKGGIDDDDD